MLERDFQKIIILRLKQTGAKILNVHGHEMQERSWPDIYIASPWYHGWVEFKIAPNWLTEGQEQRAKELLERYISVFVMQCEKVDLFTLIHLITPKKQLLCSFDLDVSGKVLLTTLSESVSQLGFPGTVFAETFFQRRKEGKEQGNGWKATV